jgi:hypothetical protein
VQRSRWATECVEALDGFEGAFRAADAAFRSLADAYNVLLAVMRDNAEIIHIVMCRAKRGTARASPMPPPTWEIERAHAVEAGYTGDPCPLCAARMLHARGGVVRCDGCGWKQQ